MNRTRIAVAVGATLLALGGWFGIPQHERTVEAYKGKMVVWEHTRRWEWLPPYQWSVVPQEIFGDSANGGSHIHRVPFLFVAWEDRTETWFHPNSEVR